MSTKYFAYTRPDGGVSVLGPASPALVMEFLRYGKPTGTLSWSGSPVTSLNDVMTLADAEAAADSFNRTTHVPSSATNTVALEFAELVAGGIFTPDKRHGRFRNTCRQTSAAPPAVDMPLARLQRMNEVRAARTPKLTKSDVDLLRAREVGNTILEASLKDYRQKLRDLPALEQPNVDAIMTPDALAAWEPTWPTDPAP